MSSTTEDRKRGALLGLAVGDALGAAVEFKPPGTFEPVTDYRAGGPHGLSAGEWTDDTSMALALADSIITHAGWDLNDQARRYVSWWREGEYSVNGRCFDIEITIRAALSRFERTGDAQTSGDRRVPLLRSNLRQSCQRQTLSLPKAALDAGAML